jgi:hypothetical protein
MLGASLAPALAVGGEVAVAAYFPGKGTNVEAVPGGGFDIGPALRWFSSPTTPRVSLQASAGFAGAGAPGEWGGTGLFAAPAACVFFLNSARHHVGVHLRAKYAVLSSSDAPDADKSLFSISAGVEWTLH